MSWIIIVWSMNAGACLALAAIYFVLWCNQRKSWMHLAFSCEVQSNRTKSTVVTCRVPLRTEVAVRPIP